MERDETGRKWAHAYLKTPPRRNADRDLHCPDHPDQRLIRILGGAWICRECVRQRGGGGAPT